jgi:hypothetical protein
VRKFTNRAENVAEEMLQGRRADAECFRNRKDAVISAMPARMSRHIPERRQPDSHTSNSECEGELGVSIPEVTPRGQPNTVEARGDLMGTFPAEILHQPVFGS